MNKSEQQYNQWSHEDLVAELLKRDDKIAVAHAANKEMGDALERIAKHVGFTGTCTEVAEKIECWGALSPIDDTPERDRP
jgi:hypothetical protein